MRGYTVNSVESFSICSVYGYIWIGFYVECSVKLRGLISQNQRDLELCQSHGFAAKIAGLFLLERSLVACGLCSTLTINLFISCYAF